MSPRERDEPAPGPDKRTATSVVELTCADIRDQLNDLLDGSLDPTTVQRLERHLAQCTDCRTLSRGLEQTVRGLKQSPPVHLPTGARDRLRQRLNQQPVDKSVGC
ncbi:MAG: anti-sigma factor family protein [Chloroflexota bacterium]